MFKCSPYFSLLNFFLSASTTSNKTPVTWKQHGKIYYAWQDKNNAELSLSMKLCSTTVVLDVHKLPSFLPHRASPSVAQTSYGFPLVTVLYVSKQSFVHITTWGEAVNNNQAATTFFFCDNVWGWLHLCVETDTSREGETLFKYWICTCCWVYILKLSKHLCFSDQLSERKSKRSSKHSILDKEHSKRKCLWQKSALDKY